MSRFRSLRRAYRALALVCFNALLLLLAGNLLLFGVFELVDGRRARRDARSPESLSRHGEVHPGLEPEQIRALWEETYLASSGFVYEPYTQFKVRAFEGRYVTIDGDGFRRHPETGPWPPEPTARNVFLYGGSTTFGYGVADGDTIAAHLQRYLDRGPGPGGKARPVRVYNFGRSGYFSTQERLLFERHLWEGLEVDAAIFIDGLNECRIEDAVPIFTARLRRQFAAPRAGLGPVLARLPMMRLARAVTRRGRGEPGPRSATAATGDAAARMAAGYLANKRLVEAAAAVRAADVLFVWQPVPFYGYDRAYHLFADTEEPLVEAGYRYMAELVARGEPGGRFLWLADMQAGLSQPLYVDRVHYSGAMSRRIAAEIGDRLRGPSPGSGPDADAG